MNTCRCEEYRKIVDDYMFFSFGTLHYLTPRHIMPKDKCLKWVCNKTNFDDLRFTKLILVDREKDKSKTEEKPEKLPIESKWIPVLPGLISQRLVNERKNPNMKSPY